MAEQKKLAKRLRMFKELDEASLLAAISETTMGDAELKAANDGMEHLYNRGKVIQEQSTEATETTARAPKRTKEDNFKLFLKQFLKDLGNYEFRQELDQFQIGIENYLTFRKELHGDFHLHLRDTYLAKIDSYQDKINRVVLLLAHDRGFIWDQEQREHESMGAGNWKERVQTLGYSHRTVSNYISFFNLCEDYPRILTSSAYFSEWCCFLSRFKGELKKNGTLATRCSESLMME